MSAWAKGTPEHEEILEEIQDDEASESATAALERAIGAFLYTTTILVELATWLRENDDPDGADLVLAFSADFAEHEASTL